MAERYLFAQLPGDPQGRTIPSHLLHYPDAKDSAVNINGRI